MKRWILSSSLVAAMLLVSTSAFAAGINLAWNNCATNGGVANKTFACASNTGSSAMMGTWSESTAHTNVSGVEVIIDLITSDASIPLATGWWSFKTAGSCRQNALSAAAYNGDGTTCVDWAAGQASINIASYTIGDHGVNTARIKMVNAVAQAALATLDPNFEYGVFAITVNNTKTVGTGACTGCAAQVCIVFNSLNVTTFANADNRLFVDPSVTGSNIITWQGTGANCAAVPTRNTTWGSVKSLYR